MLEKDIMFETIVGSHAWKMNRPDSDIDSFQVYVVPTKDILMGLKRQNSHFTAGDRDQFRHEIGVVIEQLLSGNFNFIVGVMSPEIITNNYGLNLLKHIVVRNLAKNCYNSIHGLAYSNYRKYVVNRQETGEKLQKRCNIIVRTLLFGQNILNGEGVQFTPVKDCAPETVEEEMTKLDEALKNSKLPDKPDPNPFREYLYDLRIRNLGFQRTYVNRNLYVLSRHI